MSALARMPADLGRSPAGVDAVTRAPVTLIRSCAGRAGGVEPCRRPRIAAAVPP
jgi:hypothetical protein